MSPADRLLVLAGVTLPGGRRGAAAIGIRNGRIVSVGSRADVVHACPVGAPVREMEGATVLPGLVDAHGHVLAHGFALARLDLRDVASYEELVDRVAARAGRLPAGRWILGQGWDHTRWPGGALPHHDLLSRVTPEHPVHLRRIDMHAALVNARAMASVSLTRASTAPEGGRIVRDADGEPTGLLIDEAAGLVESSIPPPSASARRDALERALIHVARLGITAVHDAGVGYAPDLGVMDQADPGWATVDQYRQMQAEHRLPVRVCVMLGGNFAHPPLASYFARPPLAPDAEGRLRVQAVKIGVDGALGSRGAALEEPYEDDPLQAGLLTRSAEETTRIARRALETGWQIAIHAIGDRANRVALDALDAARRTVPSARDPRPRIEHAQVLRASDVRRFGEGGVIASVQPVHAVSDHRWVGERLGRRVQGAYAYASLAAHGACLAAGSDFPVEDPDPLMGLQAAVARRDGNGRPEIGWRMEEALDLTAALAAFTRGAAHAAFMESETGRLRPGMRADLTLVDRDPFTVSPEEIGRLQVQLTVVEGETVFDATAAPAGEGRS
ncbi:MAG: amidohydrolase [Acidobacteriota bacterium]